MLDVMAASTGTRADDAAGPALYLDWIRGIAALLVLVTHLRLGFFAAWNDLDAASRNAANAWLFAFTGLGRQAVVVFFVLSGYLVGGQALASYRQNAFRAGSYFIARISRLYTVLIPALVLTAVFDSVSGEWTPTADGPRSFIVNVLFLQGLFGPSYGSNTPLWSLSYEWWYYALFGALLAVGSRVRESRFWAAAIGLAFIVAASAVIAERCSAILWMYPLWLMGVAVASVRLSSARLSRAVIAIAAVGLLAAMVIASTRNTLASDYLVGIFSAIVIYAATRTAAPASRPSRWGHTLAAFSFTLYVIHMPLWLMMQPVLVVRRHGHAGIADWLQLAAIACMILFVCYGVYLLFEKRTPWVRSRLQRGWNRLTGRSAARPGAPADSAPV